MKERIIKALLFIGVLLMLSQAKAQNPNLMPYKFSCKVVKVSELGEYELRFTCDTKGRDFGLRLSNVSLNEHMVHVYGLSKYNSDGCYTFKVRTSLVPKEQYFGLIIRDMYFNVRKVN